MEHIGYFDERYKYWEDGPFLARINRMGIMIETAFDIDGIFYRLGGISSKKSKSTVSMVLRQDALKFYENELNNTVYPKSAFSKRKIQYSIKFGKASNTINLLLVRIAYIDVVLYRIWLQLKYRNIIKKEIKEFSRQ